MSLTKGPIYRYVKTIGYKPEIAGCSYFEGARKRVISTITFNITEFFQQQTSDNMIVF